MRWRALTFTLGLAVVCSLSTTVQGGPLIAGYSVDSPTDTLHLIDVQTGSAEPIGTGVGGYADVEGLAFHPLTGALYGFDDATKTLITINTKTGVGASVSGGNGNSGLPFGQTDVGLAFDRQGRLFASTSAVSPYKFYSVNPITGLFTEVSTLPQMVSGLADAQGILYGLSEGPPAALVTIDKVSGALSVVGPLGISPDFESGGLAHAGTDLYGLDETSGHIFLIDKATGAASVIATIPDGSLLGFEGFAIVVTPEPSSLLVWTMLGLTALGVCHFRRRRSLTCGNRC